MSQTAEKIGSFEDVSNQVPSREQAATSVVGEIAGHIGRRRWIICTLLFFAATVNYVDRQVIGILKPTLQAEFGWNEVAYGWIVF